MKSPKSNNTSNQHPKQPLPIRQINIHHHYHYYSKPQQSSILQRETKLFSKVRSDQKYKSSIPTYEKTQTDSISSQRSWKKLVKPQFQSTGSTFKSSQYGSTPMTSAQPSKRKYSQRLTGAQISEFNIRLPYSPNSRQLRSSTMLPNNSNQQSYSTLCDQSFGKIPEIQQFSYGINSQKRKNRFIKKRDYEQVNVHHMMQMTERPSTSIAEDNYQYSLLEEECKYLRDKFLEHYVRQHGKQI